MKNSKAEIKPGDLIELGPHRLMCGDARNPEHVKKLLKGIKLRAVITDPPYGVAYVENKKHFKKTIGANISAPREIIGDEIQSEEGYAKFTHDWIRPALKSMEAKNAFYIFNCDMMACAVRTGMKLADIYYSQMIIWIKNNIVVGRKDYHPQHEIILYGWHKAHKFERSKDKSVIFYPKPHRSGLHPTMKPVGLIRQIVLNATKKQEWVYDPFGGSGTTLMACEQTYRRCAMLEIDPHYCAIIKQRYDKLILNQKQQ